MGTLSSFAGTPELVFFLRETVTNPTEPTCWADISSDGDILTHQQSWPQELTTMAMLRLRLFTQDFLWSCLYEP
jgi:hypothetical protein